MVAQAFQPLLEQEQVGDVTVVKFRQSELLDEEQIQAVSRQLHQVVDCLNGRQVVLNLDAVEKLSTRMVGTFIALHRKSRSHGGRLVLCGIDDNLWDIFVILKLPQLLRICREEQEALQAF